MSNLSEKIVSLREVVGRDYLRPPAEKMEELIANLNSPQGEEALHYLKAERGFTEDTIKHFKLGYDPKKDAVSIPVFKNKELINIKYRFLKPDKMKYIGEPGAETWVYNEEGIDVGKVKGGVLVVEGEFDLMSCWQSGIKNVVSPASGKDSYGVWLELLDSVGRVYIAYDNDKPGKQASMKLAERTGVEKSFEVKYPEDVKDANEFFKKYTRDDFLDLIKKANAFYTYQYQSAGDILFNLMEDEEEFYEISLLPGVKMEKDWLVVLSGKSNVGKTSACLNFAKELAKKGYGSLVIPFERGNTSVGKRFLQVFFDKTIDDFRGSTKEQLQKMALEVNNLPVYFTVPKTEEVNATIIKAKRLFDTKFVFIDHLDYMVRQGGENYNVAVSKTLQELKSLAMEHKIVIVVITHTRKTDGPGADAKRKPGIEDLKGSSSLYQDPECVIMLSSDEPSTINIDVVKNKGEMRCTTFKMNALTGTIGGDPNDF